MSGDLPLGFWLGLWIAAAAAVFFVRWKQRAVTAGLVYGYLFIFWMFHWVGAALYLRKFAGSSPEAVVLAGLRESTFGVVAFAAGALIFGPILSRWFRSRSDADVVYQPHRDMLTAYLLVGCSAYVIGGVFGNLPSMAAISSVSQQFLIVGICLNLRQAWIEHSPFGLALWLAATLVLPFFTILTQGFLGFGAMAAFTIFCFLSHRAKSLWRFAGATLLLGILFLSLYESYMRDRVLIRDSVWGGASMEDRLERVASMLATLEWFDPFDDAHARRIDQRLNQDYLVGRSVEFMSGRDAFVYGETIEDAALAVIPRAIWPDKPMVAGSGNLVTRFTGLRFSLGTSVGIGQVMEWYANFGSSGVVVWFLFAGTFLAVVDTKAGLHLRNENWQAFSMWYLPGLSMLNLGGSMVEVTASAAAALVVGVFVNRVVLHRMQQKRQRAPGESYKPGIVASA